MTNMDPKQNELSGMGVANTLGQEQAQKSRADLLREAQERNRQRRTDDENVVKQEAVLKVLEGNEGVDQTELKQARKKIEEEKVRVLEGDEKVPGEPGPEGTIQRIPQAPDEERPKDKFQEFMRSPAARVGKIALLTLGDASIFGGLYSPVDVLNVGEAVAGVDAGTGEKLHWDQRAVRVLVSVPPIPFASGAIVGTYDFIRSAVIAWRQGNRVGAAEGLAMHSRDIKDVAKHTISTIRASRPPSPPQPRT